MKKPNKSEEFIQYYNKIEDYMQKILNIKTHKPFWLLLKDASDKNRIIYEYREDLEAYSKLRNAIVHSGTNKTIAEPHDDALESIRKIYQMLIKPPSALSLFGKDVFICNLDDNLYEIAKIMAEKDYTQIPIYEGSAFKGLLTGSTYVKFIASQTLKDHIDFNKESTVKDILPHTTEQFYRFINADVDVFTVLDYFLEFTEIEERLECVIITQNGGCDEKPIGIATTWDIPLIKKIR